MYLANNDVPKSIVTGCPGWHTNLEAETLIALAKNLSDGAVIVELGTEYGRAATEFAYATQHLKSVKIFSIDLFPADHFYAKNHGGLLAVWQNNIRESGFAGHIQSIQSDTVSAAKKFSFKVDLLFIDAGHHYSEVKNDIEAWWKHIKVGGFIVFHDYWKNAQSHPIHLEVKKAVDEWYEINIGLWQKYDAPDSLVYFVRLENATGIVIEEKATQVIQPLTKSNKLMTVQELSAYLGESLSAIRKTVKSVEVAGKRGKANLYDLQQVQRVMNG